MTRTPYKLFLLFLLVAVAACSYEFPEPPYPRVETLDATDVSQSSVTFHANINATAAENIVNHGFVWDDQPRFFVDQADRVDLGTFSGKRVVDAEVERTFDANTTYYVMAFVQTETYTVYGIAVPFTP